MAEGVDTAFGGIGGGRETADKREKVEVFIWVPCGLAWAGTEQEEAG